MKKIISGLFTLCLTLFSYSSMAVENKQPANTLYRSYCDKIVSVDNVSISVEGVSPLSVRKEFLRSGAIELTECVAPSKYHINKYALVGTYKNGENIALILSASDYLTGVLDGNR